MSTADTAHFQRLLAEGGFRVTAARKASFELLLSPHPQSMADILAKAKKLNIDRVSVYRSIDLFEKLGIVHRIYVGWKYKLELSDQFVAHHHHMSCLNCGKIIDIQDEAHIDAFISQIAKQSGFTPRRHQFEIDGYCQDCS